MSDEEVINLSKYQINYKKCCPKCGSTNFVKAGFTNKGHKGTNVMLQGHLFNFTGTPMLTAKKTYADGFSL